MVSRLLATGLSLLLFCMATPVLAEEALTVAQIEEQTKQTRDFDKAMHQLTRLLQREPRNAQAYMIGGQILEARGYSNLADQMYQQADECDPSQPDANLQKFYHKLREGGILAAGDYLGYLVDRFPNDTSVLIMQGISARMHNHYDQAVYFYRRALDVDPKASGARTGIASIQMLRGKFNEALKEITEELRMHPNDPAALLAKGELCLFLSKPEEALPALERVYQFKTNSAIVDKRKVGILAMSAAWMAGKHDIALEYGLQAIASTEGGDTKSMNYLKHKISPLLKTVPENEVMNVEAMVERECTSKREVATLRFALGDMMDLQGHGTVAADLYRKGLDLIPAAARGHYRLAARLIKERDYANGLIYASQAHAEDMMDPQIGGCYLRINDRLNNHKRDTALQLKDWLHGGVVTDVEFSRDI